MSKVVHSTEQGTLFACIAFFETLGGVIAVSTFNGIYSATVAWYTGFIFLLSAGLLLIPMISLCVVKCSSWNKRSNALLIQEDASEDTSDAWFIVISKQCTCHVLWLVRHTAQLSQCFRAGGGYVLSSGPSRERSRGSSGWRTAYFKHFMNIVWCFSSTENKSQSTCPFGIYKRNWT